MHGTCLPINAFSYSCKCLEGHGGVLCDEEEDLFNPCQMIKCKHGKCRLSGVGQPYCECNSGFTGDSCDRGKLGTCSSAQSRGTGLSSKETWTLCGWLLLLLIFKCYAKTDVQGTTFPTIRFPMAIRHLITTRFALECLLYPSSENSYPTHLKSLLWSLDPHVFLIYLWAQRDYGDGKSALV